MDKRALEARIAQALSGQHIDMRACQHTMGDSLMSRRLIRAFQYGGLETIKKEQDLYEWAAREFEHSPQCFSFKLWLSIERA